MLLTEYDAKKQRKMDIRDAKAEGRTEGMAEGRELERIDWMLKKVKRGWSLKMMADDLEVEPESLRAMYEAAASAKPGCSAEEVYRRLHGR